MFVKFLCAVCDNFSQNMGIKINNIGKFNSEDFRLICDIDVISTRCTNECNGGGYRKKSVIYCQLFVLNQQ